MRLSSLLPVLAFAAAYAVLSLADFAWQRMQYKKGLMMSKEDIKQEFNRELLITAI